jgi:prophage regulatory protein
MSDAELAMRICPNCDQEKSEAEFHLLARDGCLQDGMQVCTECRTKNGAPDNGPRPRRMLNEKQVLEIVPVGRTTLYRMEKAGRFPRSTYISPNRRVWFEDDIIAWQNAVDELNPSRGRGKGRRRQYGREATT